MSTQVNNVQIKEQDLKFLVEHVLKDWEYLEQEDHDRILNILNSVYPSNIVRNILNSFKIEGN